MQSSGVVIRNFVATFDHRSAMVIGVRPLATPIRGNPV